MQSTVIIGYHPPGVESHSSIYECRNSSDGRQVKALREQARVSQAVFAAELNTSLSMVQKWEVRDKKPSGPSLNLLNLIERKGLDALI